MYYHSLTPFRELFGTGVPVLTWHKLGSRPRGVRLKGLYLGAELFCRQLAELRAAGFRTPPLVQVFPIADDWRRKIVLTFDDGFASVLRHGLGPLAESGFRATEFLVADRIGRTNEWDRCQGEAPEPLMDSAQVRDWLAAGHDIGSHSCTHPFLTRLSRDEARREIEASKKKLEDRFNRPVDYFCYPYGDWDEAVRDLVAAAGYRAAFTTVTGVNTPAEPLLSLKRFTARYPSRNLKAFWSRLRAGHQSNCQK